MLAEQTLTAARPEKRTTARRHGVLRCRVADASLVRFARLTELSYAGARVLTALPPRVGAEVTVRFRIGRQTSPIEASGVVVWRSDGFLGRGGVMGVRFVDISDERALTRYLNEA